MSVCAPWDLAGGNNLCYANEKKIVVFCLDQKPELSGRSRKGVVQLENQNFIHLASNRTGYSSD